MGITRNGLYLQTMEIDIDAFHPCVLNVGLARHQADWNWKNVISPFARLYYVTEGHARVVFGDRAVELCEGRMYFIPPFVRHSYECDSSFCHYYVHIYEAPQAVCLFLQDWDLPDEVEAGGLVQPLFETLCLLNPAMRLSASDPSSYDNSVILASNLLRNKQRPMFKKMFSRGIVYQLLAPFFKTASPKAVIADDRIKQSVAYIRDHLSGNVDIGDVARHLFISKNHYIRLFKNAMGITPMRFIIHQKVEKAQLLLITSQASVKQIALDMSFEDVSYFNRVFKKVTGVSPSEYRKSVRLHT